MSEPSTSQAPPPADTPPVEGGEGEEGPSKKALKKAEAKAKKGTHHE